MSKFILVLALLTVAALFLLLPTSYSDWVDHYRPAALHLWVNVDTIYVYNPPWLLPILYPLALLPPRWGAALLASATLGILAVYLRSPWKLLAVTASAPCVLTISQGQIDALPLVGLLVPAGLGLPVLLVKPQGVLLAALPRLNPRSVALVVALVALSVLIWGSSWLSPTLPVDWGPVNLSLFPWSLPLALPLVYLGLTRRRDGLLCLASLCIAPYFMIVSLLPAVAALVRDSDDWRVWLATWVGSWAFLFLARLV